jgi:hypothetical protein
MRGSKAKAGLLLLGGMLAAGLLALAWAMGPGSSEAQQDAMHNCPQPGKWAVAVWDGPDGTDTGQALATCGEGVVDFAWYLDPATNGWLGYFDGQPDLTVLLTLDNMWGVMAHGAVGGPTPTPTPTPTPGGPVTTFGDGTYVVGVDIAPGTYRNSSSSEGCYWERLSGFGGTSDEIIANEFTTIRQLVTIKESDVGFSSDDCGIWTQDLTPITASPTAPFGDGMYIVGVDIGSGTWRNDGSSGCYWARLSGFSHKSDDIIANEYADTQQTVTISPTDVGFESDGCGTWSKIH